MWQSRYVCMYIHVAKPECGRSEQIFAITKLTIRNLLRLVMVLLIVDPRREEMTPTEN